MFLNHENLLLSYWCPNINSCSSKKKAVAVRYTAYWILLLSFFQITIAGFFNGLWAKVTATGIGNYFGNILFAPPIFAVICLLLRIHPLKQIDLFTPSYIVGVIFYKIACFLHGCCNGKPWKYGFHYVLSNRREFPSQLLEILVAIFLLFLILHLVKKRTDNGKIMPIYIILYSSFRFFTEFSREGDAILFGLQNYQFQCFLGIAVGFAELLLVNKYGPAFDAWFLKKHSHKRPSKS